MDGCIRGADAAGRGVTSRERPGKESNGEKRGGRRRRDAEESGGA